MEGLKQVSQEVQAWAARLNLIDLNTESEDYILTPEEEIKAVSAAIECEKSGYKWRMLQKGKPLLQIDQDISEKDWSLVINREQVLSRSNSCKHQEIFHLNNRHREKEQEQKERQALIDRCDAKYMFNVMAFASEKTYGKKLIVNDNNRFLITAICFFLSNDPRFETDLYLDFKKGLWIRGVSGLGKTYISKCVSGNELNPITMLNVIDITEKMKYEDDYVLPAFKKLYLDDVGTEELDSKRYGSKISFVKNFIETQSLRHSNYSHLMISTNCDFETIEARYGFRVRSRIKEMFNIIDIKGSDMRG